MKRYGQGISVNVIIIAAIALVVMILLITLVLNTGTNITQSQNCHTWGDGVQYEDYACLSQGQGESCGDYGLQRAPSGWACQGSTQESPITCCVDLVG